MDQSKIDRINFLARKNKAEGLTEEEKAERAELRAEYIAAFRQSLEMHLDNTYYVDPDGTEHKLEKKNPAESAQK